jgi:tetratricopeptide (TPR) repeat protein
MALACYEAVRDTGGRIRVYSNIAGIHISEGRLEKAREALEAALSLARTSGTSTDQARTHYNMGVLAATREEHTEAIRQYEMALDIAQCADSETDDALLFACELATGVSLLEGLEDFPGSWSRFERALDLAARLHDARLRAQASRNIAYWHESVADCDAAIQAYAECIEVFTRLGDRHWAASATGRMGLCLWRANRAEEAREALERAVSELDAIGDRARADAMRRALRDIR